MIITFHLIDGSLSEDTQNNHTGSLAERELFISWKTEDQPSAIFEYQFSELLRGSSLQPVLSGYCIFFEEQESCSSLNGLISVDTAVIK